MSEKGRVALVTGGAGALGGVIAAELAGQGMSVAIGYHSSAEAAQALAEGLPGAVAVGLDITDGNSVRDAFKSVRDELGAPVTVLINSAGITRDALTMRMSPEEWEEVIDTDLTGPFRCIKQALQGMIAQRFGRIITVGSVSGALGPPGQANYAAAKSGLVGMTKTVSREVARRGITVNVVAPGLVRSPLADSLDPRLRELYINMTATGREVEPADVARAILFCVDCPALTGQVINVDGGIT